MEPEGEKDSFPCLEVVGGIIWRGERFLAAQRPKNRSQSGYWEFPGGKIEPGETPEEAVIREIREELSLEVLRPVLWKTVEHRYPHTDIILHCFHVTDFSGHPVGNDGQRFCWMTPEEAQTYPFLDADRGLLRELKPPRLE
ncbi:MAG: (deoxy)nucleoside triphosphate pyrophosphohydrolase [Desulfovibrionaceae bacterium]|nr:(deoxy)nucleoside triphosphate pyrophosphohydrolase [Desulfovibrionaceae bacterium]